MESCFSLHVVVNTVFWWLQILNLSSLFPLLLISFESLHLSLSLSLSVFQGQNLILNMNDHGFVVCAYNRTTSKVDHFLANEAKGMPMEHLKKETLPWLGELFFFSFLLSLFLGLSSFCHLSASLHPPFCRLFFLFLPFLSFCPPPLPNLSPSFLVH